MKWRSWMKFGLSVMLLSVVAVSPASSSILNNPSTSPYGVTFAGFDYYFDPYTTVNVSDYNFASYGSPTVDGKVYSQVWKYSAANLYAYMYQIEAATLPNISGISIDFKNTNVDKFWYWYAGGLNGWAFYITDNGGTEAPTSAELDPSSGFLRYYFKSGPSATINPGDTSYWFGVMIEAEPFFTVSEMYDSGAVSSATVYAPSTAPPVPEPGTMMLLGSGLVGLAGWGRKKFRK